MPNALTCEGSELSLRAQAARGRSGKDRLPLLKILSVLQCVILIFCARETNFLWQPDKDLSVPEEPHNSGPPLHHSWIPVPSRPRLMGEPNG